MKYCEKARLLTQRPIGKEIFDMTLLAPQIAAVALPGQFVSVYCKDNSRLLPRPISICEADPAAGTLRLVYRAAGAGTREFAGYQEGEGLDLTGPLGNGFPLAQQAEHTQGHAFVIGGGIGIPPMLALAKALPGTFSVILGYRDERFLVEDFKAMTKERPGCGVYIATEDGSAGTRGTVLDCIREHGLRADVLYACGPVPMLKALKEYAAEEKIAAYLSMEQRMACGVGACLGCVCASAKTDPHSGVHNKRVCAEGPVFRAEEIIL